MITITDSILADNLVGGRGGAAYIITGTATIQNSTLKHNTALENGGALAGYAELLDVTLLANVAPEGGHVSFFDSSVSGTR